LEQVERKKRVSVIVYETYLSEIENLKKSLVEAKSDPIISESLISIKALKKKQQTAGSKK
jgi:hypothetical protein